MASTTKIVALKKKLAAYRLQIEMGLAEYVALNPKKSYRDIGERFGYPASTVCEIAKKYGVNRNPKTPTTEPS
jgi:hypothetical protein